MLSLNYMAKKALETATKRGKVDSRTTDMEQIQAIRVKLAELAADVIIAALTYLARKNVDVDLLLISKMIYNANRED